jgi:hypothetical protein
VRCIGRQLGERAAAAALVAATIISRIAVMRSPSKNMCSVRQSPIPSAPNARAMRASRGVSAFARTRSVRDLVGPPSTRRRRGTIAAPPRHCAADHAHHLARTVGRSPGRRAAAAVEREPLALARRTSPR